MSKAFERSNSTLGIDTSSYSIAVVASRWNNAIVDMLIEGSTRAFIHYHIPESNSLFVRCPGSYELPLVMKKIAETKKFDAVVGLGCVIRGETIHFELVAEAASTGIMRAQMDTGVPCVFGVVTTDTTEQALARATHDESNKGYEAVVTAVEMITLLKHLSTVLG